MTTIDKPAPVAAPASYRKGSIIADWLSSTDHKIIGHLYLITSFGFFLAAGLMAMIMRAQLMGPDNHLVWRQLDVLSPGGYGFAYLQDGPDRWRMQVTRRLAG